MISLSALTMNYAQSVLQANRGNKAGRVGGNKPRHARGHRGEERAVPSSLS